MTLVVCEPPDQLQWESVTLKPVSRIFRVFVSAFSACLLRAISSDPYFQDFHFLLQDPPDPGRVSEGLQKGSLKGSLEGSLKGF